MIEEGVHDYFIQLNFGLRSSKQIDYSPETEKYYILNEIDDTEQELDEKQLFDRVFTNIGYAIQNGALYSYE
jgi:hypothetical protein